MKTETGVTGRAHKEVELIERHIRMLYATKMNQPVGIIRLSEILDLPRHIVRYSLRILEKDGVIIATPEGAVVSDRYDAFMKETGEYLAHLIEHIKEVKDLVPDT